MTPLRRILAGLTLATAAATGTLTAAGPATADTGWGVTAPTPPAPADDTNDTGWGTPPTTDPTSDPTARPYDTGWG